MTAFARVQHQDSERLSNPESTYRRSSLTFGYSTPVFFDILFSVNQTVSILEETNLRAVSHPRTTTYALSRHARVGDTPISTSLDLRYVDEEESESLRSFLV